MTWNNFFHFLGPRNVLVNFATFCTAAASVLWVQGSLPWNHLVLLAIALLSLDTAFAAFQKFFQYEDEGARVPSRPGLLLILALGLLAFAAVLGLFLVIWKGWPLLVLGALGLLGTALASPTRRSHPSSLPRGLLAGLTHGTLLWALVYFVASPDPFAAPWLRLAAFSLPGFLFVTTTRIGETHRTWGVVLPLSAYGVVAALGLTGLLPWSFLPAAFLGPTLSIPFWRRHGTHPETALQTYLVFCLLSCLAWALGTMLS